jgi:hypothetical protein
MMDEDLAEIRARRENIARYWQLLRRGISGSEGRFLQGRLEEERIALNTLIANTFPQPLGKTNPSSGIA